MFHFAILMSKEATAFYSVGLVITCTCSVFLIEDIMFLLPQTHLTFGKEFTEAVEMKQVAQQEAERARFVVEKVRRRKGLFETLTEIYSVR